jgi:GTPase SAR1 family protein
VDNIEWLRDQLETFMEDDYLLIDCPGQIELYSHVPVMKQVRNSFFRPFHTSHHISGRTPSPLQIVNVLKSVGFNVCGVYCVDSLFITDASKLIAGNLMALSAMVYLELPHINVRSHTCSCCLPLLIHLPASAGVDKM